MRHKVTSKSLANLKPAKKGEVRNPLGKNNTILGGFKRITAIEIQQVISILMNKSDVELKKIWKDKRESVLCQALAQTMLRWRDTGDEKKMNALFDRTAGKVSEKLQVFSADEDPNKEQLTEEQKLVIIAKNIKRLGMLEDE